MLSHLILKIAQWSCLQWTNWITVITQLVTGWVKSSWFQGLFIVLYYLFYLRSHLSPLVSSALSSPLDIGYCYFSVVLTFFFFRILCQNWMGLLDLDGERKWMGFNWALTLMTVIISSGFLDIKKKLILNHPYLVIHSVIGFLFQTGCSSGKGRAEAYESLEFWPQVLVVFLRKRFIILIRFSQKLVICLQKKRLRTTDTLAFGS